MAHPTPRRIAVVGSGVAGLSAAYVASHPANGAHVTLLEADDRLGGHADTHDVVDPTGRALRIDSGFIVHNRRTYPVLLRLFEELGVPTQESEMSMSISDEATGLEWGRLVNGKSPTAQRMLKYSFNLIDDGLVGQQLFAGETTRLAYMTDEAQEGRDQFLEKRDPDWSPYPWYY